MSATWLGRLLVLSCLTLSPTLGPAPSVAPATEAAVSSMLALPRKEGSLRFAVIGDVGRDSRGRSDVATQMVAFRRQFPFDSVILLGDNIYGAIGPADVRAKFEVPYKPLLDAGVVFHAVIGNHDNPNVRFYDLLNMAGQRYYTFLGTKGVAATGLGSVRFFALDSGYLDQAQLDWLDTELAASDAQWKIVFFHHPLYSSGRTHGSALESRAVLEPLFVKHGVSVVFSGHDHFYERIKPQKGGIVYWVAGGGGSLRKGDIRATNMTAKGFDRDYHFLLVEIVGDDLHFQAITRAGTTIESGVVHRPGAPTAEASQPISALTPALP